MNKIPNYDVFGYCVNCGKRMITHEVIDGIYQTRLSGEYTTVRYVLDDDSTMRVAMCKTCAGSLDGSEYDHVMGKVYRGWQHEIETYSDWEQEKKDAYYEKYSKRKIVVRQDDTENFKKYKKEKERGTNKQD